MNAIRGHHQACSMDNVSALNYLILSLTTDNRRSTEHLLGIIIASLPALRPLFKRILEVATTQRSGSSGLSFRKMHRSDRGVHVQISSLVNAASSSGRTIATNNKDITKTTELRISTETDLNFIQEPSSAWVTPDRDRPFGYEHV